jgi:PAS domain S-box-containing protein
MPVFVHGDVKFAVNPIRGLEVRVSSTHNRLPWSAPTLDSRIFTALLAFLVAATGHLAAKMAGALVISVPQMVWPIWPGCAILLGILLIVPRRVWPVLLPAGLAGFVFYDLQVGVSISSIALLILADTLEILVALWSVTYFLKGKPRLDSLGALAKYCFCTVFLASLIVSSIGSLALSGDYWLSWRFSFLSEALAFLTVTPAIIGLFGLGRETLRASRAHYLEAAILVFMLISLSYLIFVAPGRSAPPALLYSLVPLLIWSALRFGAAGVGFSATIVALMSIWGAIHGRGPFTEADPINRVLSLQIFLFCTSAPFMVLAVLVEERKAGQLELGESEERLRLSMDSGKAVGWDWDLKTGTDTWFGDLNTMFGIQAERFVGRPEDFHRYLHPEDKNKVSEAVAVARKTHQPYAQEFRVVWPDGTVRWVAARGKFYYSESGVPERMLGMSHDVTERKLVDQALYESESDLTEAQRLANMGSWQWDVLTDTVTWSEQLYRIVGMDPSLPAVSYLGHEKLYTPESWLRLRSAVEEALLSGAPYELDLEMVRLDGTTKWIIAKGEVRRDGAGNIVKIRGTVDDITVRKRAQEELRKSEERLRLAIQAGKMFTCDWDPVTDIFTHSPECAQILRGDNTTCSTRQQLLESVHPDDREKFTAAAAGISPERPDIRVSYRMVRSDGTIIWLEKNSRAQFDQQSKLLRIIGIVTDITERKRAEESVRASEERLRLAVQAGRMFAYEWDASTDLLVRSAESAQILGIPEATPLTGQQVLAKVHPDDRDRLVAAVGELSPENPSLAITYRMLRPDGSMIWLERNSRAHFDENGKLLRIIGIVADITARKRAEEAQRESEQRFRLVANTAPMLIWMADTHRLCTYINHSWLAFTGRPMELELGNGWAEGVHPDDLQWCLDTYVRAFDAREKFKMEYRLRRYDGEYRWILDLGVPRFNQDGTFAGYIGSCMDVTDRKLAEETLSGVNSRLIEAQERERARISRELHDDISQRLAMLTIELEQLGQKFFDSPPDLLHRVARLRNLSSDLASDVQALSHELHSSKLDYLGISTALGAFCHEFSNQQNVEVAFAHDEIPRTLSQDISLCLFRVSQEALQNAVKHSGVRHFDVELRCAPDAISLTVHDSGAGFDREGALRTKGLGLVSMAERVKLVGGRFSIDTQPHRGTTIRARVPLSKAASASA